MLHEGEEGSFCSLRQESIGTFTKLKDGPQESFLERLIVQGQSI